MSYYPSTQQPTSPPLDWPYYGIGFVPAIKRGFAKYAHFTGRASLSEYWWWMLFVAGVGFVLSILNGLTTGNSGKLGIFGVAFTIFWLGVVVPSIALTIRRLHDTGRSGWYYFLSLIPMVGGIILLVFLASSTKPESAKYGPPLPSQPTSASFPPPSF